MDDLANSNPEGAAISDPSGGTNQSRVGAYNARLILTIIQRNKALSKSAIAKRTGLSAQTVSIIMRRLEEDGLLLRGDPVRGKVGQPSVPMSLNPDGAYSYGVKIGRRTAELILMDLTGAVRGRRRIAYAYPTPVSIAAFVIEAVGAMSSEVPHADRMAGIGVAMPFELWNWAEAMGAPPDHIADWREVDLGAQLKDALGLSVYIENDGTAACGAELFFGQGTSFPDFLYVYIGAFIGGGIVLNHAVYPGRGGNAGALGSMPVPGGQLIGRASLIQLERALQEAGRDPNAVWKFDDDWTDLEPHLGQWIDTASEGIATAILSASCVIDFAATLIDGALPNPVLQRLVEAVTQRLDRADSQGMSVPEIRQGAVGPDARAIGGASLPLFARYFLDRNVLFKS